MNDPPKAVPPFETATAVSSVTTVGSNIGTPTDVLMGAERAKLAETRTRSSSVATGAFTLDLRAVRSRSARSTLADPTTFSHFATRMASLRAGYQLTGDLSLWTEAKVALMKRRFAFGSGGPAEVGRGLSLLGVGAGYRDGRSLMIQYLRTGQRGQRATPQQLLEFVRSDAPSGRGLRVALTSRSPATAEQWHAIFGLTMSSLHRAAAGRLATEAATDHAAQLAMRLAF